MEAEIVGSAEVVTPNVGNRASQRKKSLKDKKLFTESVIVKYIKSAKR